MRKRVPALTAAAPSLARFWRATTSRPLTKMNTNDTAFTLWTHRLSARGWIQRIADSFQHSHDRRHGVIIRKQTVMATTFHADFLRVIHVEWNGEYHGYDVR